MIPYLCMYVVIFGWSGMGWLALVMLAAVIDSHRLATCLDGFCLLLSNASFAL